MLLHRSQLNQFSEAVSNARARLDHTVNRGGQGQIQSQFIHKMHLLDYNPDIIKHSHLSQTGQITTLII